MTVLAASTGGSMDRYVNVGSFDSVGKFCERYIGELEKEVEEVQKNGAQTYHLTNGLLLAVSGRTFLYQFETDTELNLADGMQVELVRGAMRVSATLSSCQEYTLTIATQENLGADLRYMELTANPWYLLEELRRRLEEISQTDQDSPIVRALVCDGSVQAEEKELNTGQQRALEMAVSQPVTMIWGPPGTGKTQTLAAIALELIKRGSRVLMLSQSNVAVDGAVLRTWSMAEGLRSGSVVRFGYPKMPELLENGEINAWQLALSGHPELVLERDSLLEEQKESRKDPIRQAKIRKRLREIRERLSEEELEVVRNARFVATTLTKATLDPNVYGAQFDAVIIDEASMAYIPQIVFAASLAAQRFICIGDFRQLPPIVQNEDDDSYLLGDIFQYCRVAQTVDRGLGHKWLCLLDEQYRMHPELADFIGRSMYHGLLCTAAGLLEERRNIAKNDPMPGKVFGLVDLTGFLSTCTKAQGYSHLNVLSAFVSVALAVHAAKNSETGIITPYNAQSRLITSMARDAMAKDPSLKPITCATVHQFQGSEKDVIIYDAVDCFLEKYPGVLLTRTRNDLANRLFNVAFTRAKGKFITVVNRRFMKDRGLGGNLLYAKTIQHAAGHGTALRDRQVEGLFYGCTQAGLQSFFSSSEAYPRWFRDIDGAKKEILIDMPGTEHLPVREDHLAQHLAQAQVRGVTVILRTPSVDAVPQPLRRFAVEKSYVYNPVAVIDRKVTWYGVPVTAADFRTSEPFPATRNRPIFRFYGKHTAQAVSGFLEMNRTREVNLPILYPDGAGEDFPAWVSKQKICPECGKPMLLKSGGKRPFFGCSSYPDCSHTEKMTREFVDSYLREEMHGVLTCPYDGEPLAAGRAGGFVQCRSEAKHSFSLYELARGGDHRGNTE